MKTRSFNFNMITALGIILVIVKLVSVSALDDVSWWLVLLPFYFSYIFAALYLAFMFLLMVGAGIFVGVVWLWVFLIDRK